MLSIALLGGNDCYIRVFRVYVSFWKDSALLVKVEGKAIFLLPLVIPFNSINEIMCYMSLNTYW